MLIFHASEDVPPEQRVFRTCLVHGQPETLESLAAYAGQFLPRQYANNWISYGMTEEQNPQFAALIDDLYQECRGNVCSLLAQEFTSGYHDGVLLQRKSHTQHATLDVAKVQNEHLQSDGDLERVLRRATVNGTHKTVLDLMRHRREDIRALSLITLRFGRSCSLKVTAQ